MSQLDNTDACRVFWVGLSAKITACEDEGPLSPTTNSGSLLCQVEGRCSNISTYRTNLVKCAPLNDNGKLRYPNRHEIDSCLPHLNVEINELEPKIVFLLGWKVIDAVSRSFSLDLETWDGFDYTFQKHGNVYYVPIHHPSYIYVYKRKMIDDYIDGLVRVITRLL